MRAHSFLKWELILQVEDVENPLLEAQEKLADSTILFCQVRGFQAPFSFLRKDDSRHHTVANPQRGLV
jgi:hypothetical protein